MKKEKKIDTWWDKPFSKEEADAYHAPKKEGLIDEHKQRKIMLKEKADEFWSDCGEKEADDIEYILDDKNDFFNQVYE